MKALVKIRLFLALAVACAGSWRARAQSGFAEPQSSPGARVVIVEDPAAMSAFNPREEKVAALVEQGIKQLTGKVTPAAGWATFVATNDTVGIKVFSTPGAISGTRPAVVAAVVRGLIAAGVPTNQIVIWDKQLADLRQAGFDDLAQRLGVRVAGSAEAGYDDKTFYDTPLLGKLIWGDFDFLRKADQSGRKSYVSKLVSRELTKIINITPMFNHNMAGVTGNLYSLALGSVDNTLRFEYDPGRLAAAVPEIYALKELSDRVVLNITDALLCQYEGESHALLHYSVTLNQLRLSTDPVALDVLSVQEIDHFRPNKRGKESKSIQDLYQNAALLELGTADPARIRIDRRQ
ncbi:MAG TPA: DUF362 domain-containing protein [Verrucomicrobiae bacterium]|nr:DUF362 domain-containing protein [Verrucomicrobiae bacterium]